MRGRVPASRLALLAGVFLCVLAVGSCAADHFSGVGGLSRRELLQSKAAKSSRDTERPAKSDEGHDHESEHDEDHSDENGKADEHLDELLNDRDTAGKDRKKEEGDHHDDEHHDEHVDEHDEDHDEDHGDENGEEHHDEHDEDHDDEHVDEHHDEDHGDENGEEHHDEHDEDHDDEHVDEHHDEHDEDHDDENGEEHHDEHDEDHDDEHGEEHHDHESEAVAWFHKTHDHDETETSAEHLIDLYGGEGVLYEVELGILFDELTGMCESGDKHSHSHADHSSEKGRAVLTPAMLIEEHGKEGLLDVSGFEMSCTSILRCQLEEGCELTTGHPSHKDEEENLDVFKIIIAVIFFVEAIIGAMVPLVVGHFERFKLWLSILNCFSGGVFISTGFVHMLPHLFETEAEVPGLNDYPLGTVMVVIGFMVVFFVEHILFDVHSDEVFQTTNNRLHSKDLDIRTVSQAKTEQDTQHAITDKWGSMSQAVLLLMAISVHAVLEALALGLESHKNGVLLLFASIGSHKGVAAMALSARFLRNGASKKQIFYYMSAFSVIAPIGILCGLASNGVAPLAKLLLNGLAAGTFIYVGAYEVIADEFHDHHPKNSGKKPRSVKFVAVVTGATIIALLQMIPHEDHA